MLLVTIGYPCNFVKEGSLSVSQLLLSRTHQALFLPSQVRQYHGRCQPLPGPQESSILHYG